MIIGVLKEIKTEENRVAMIPTGAEITVRLTHIGITITAEPAEWCHRNPACTDMGHS